MLSSSIPKMLASLAFIACCFLVSSADSEAAAQNETPGRIIGKIQGITYEGERPFVIGWACQQGQKASILVHVYSDHSAYDTPKGTFVTFGRADLDNEPGVSQACQDHAGGKHRFRVYLPSQAFADGHERKLYLHGIRVAGNVENVAIDGSGTTKFQNPPLPALSGSYVSLNKHPRVFTTAGDLEETAKRINVPDSYSAKRFKLFADQIARDVNAHTNWDTTYSGCKIGVYLYMFSYEFEGTYGADLVRSTLGTSASAGAPAGAAVVAGRLALYTALIKAGAMPPPGAPDSRQAAALAKRILLAWSQKGFRDAHGNYLSALSQFCDEQGKQTNGAGLHIARGLVYSIQAQDLLMYLNELSDSDAKSISAFHLAMSELIRILSNEELTYWLSTEFPDQAYANGFSNELTAMLAGARLFDDNKRLSAILYGGEGPGAVALPWLTFFNHVIYGVSDTPLRPIPLKSNADPPTGPGYTTAIVAPGEINDRYRNGNAGQGIGYPMFTLQRIINAAEILRIAGYDPYGYRGSHGQSIEMAIGYYACFAKGAGFLKVITPENSHSCPNAPQYYGKLVNEVDPLLVFGAFRFPGDPALTTLEASAKAASSVGGFSTDALLFGLWRD